MPPHHARSALAFTACLLLALAPALRAAEPPPEPVCPERAGMTDAQFSAARDRWRAAHDDWEANLTAAQYLEWRSRKSSRPRSPEETKRDERFERGQRLPLPTDGYTWQAAAAERKLDAATIAALAKDKIAYGPSVTQSFSPYLEGPVFITSDSILNAFHVLFEDSFRELELRRAARFRPDFEKLLTSARQLAASGDVLTPEQATPALQHLERVLGPALVLNGTPLEFFAAANRADIQAQVDRLNAATATELPAWLAPADPASLLAIDYTRCRPVGFYTAPARLGTYFRAMRWLQLVPFRANREPEFDAMVLLACASKEDRFAQKKPTELMRSLIGPVDDPTPLALSRMVINSTDGPKIGDFRNDGTKTLLVELMIQDGYYRINSDLRERRTLAKTFDQLTFRIVPQAAFPDSELFQRLLDRNQAPSGLVVSALLGSPFAENQLDPPSRTLIGQTRQDRAAQIRYDRGPSSLYDFYLLTLGELFTEPDPAAPDFVKGSPWAAKSCHTALGSWVQMRHTFTLQAKTSFNLLCLTLLPPGFIEPNPGFFSRMKDLIISSDLLLTRAGVYQPTPLREADRLREVSEYIAKEWISAPIDPASGEPELNEVSDHGEPQEETRRMAWDEFEEFGKAHGWSDSQSHQTAQFNAHARELVSYLDAKTRQIEQGELTFSPPENNLRERWQKFERIVSRLETLAHKQLRNQPWTEDETAFLKSYGEQLGFIHNYHGNSWMSPRDDAPRWAEVSGLPENGKFLAAGVGRPRAFYVLYPWNGIEVLCVGSVMQYYEYETAERLTDDAWRALLDSPAAPPLPAWLQPYAPPPTPPRAGRD